MNRTRRRIISSLVSTVVVSSVAFPAVASAAPSSTVTSSSAATTSASSDDDSKDNKDERGYQGFTRGSSSADSSNSLASKKVSDSSKCMAGINLAYNGDISTKEDIGIDPDNASNKIVNSEEFDQFRQALAKFSDPVWLDENLSDSDMKKVDTKAGEYTSARAKESSSSLKMTLALLNGDNAEAAKLGKTMPVDIINDIKRLVKAVPPKEAAKLARDMASLSVTTAELSTKAAAASAGAVDPSVLDDIERMTIDALNTSARVLYITDKFTKTWDKSEALVKPADIANLLDPSTDEGAMALCQMPEDIQSSQTAVKSAMGWSQAIREASDIDGEYLSGYISDIAGSLENIRADSDRKSTADSMHSSEADESIDKAGDTAEKAIDTADRLTDTSALESSSRSSDSGSSRNSSSGSSSSSNSSDSLSKAKESVDSADSRVSEAERSSKTTTADATADTVSKPGSSDSSSSDSLSKSEASDLGLSSSDLSSLSKASDSDIPDISALSDMGDMPTDELNVLKDAYQTLNVIKVAVNPTVDAVTTASINSALLMAPGNNDLPVIGKAINSLSPMVNSFIGGFADSLTPRGDKDSDEKPATDADDNASADSGTAASSVSAEDSLLDIAERRGAEASGSDNESAEEGQALLETADSIRSSRGMESADAPSVGDDVLSGSAASGDKETSSDKTTPSEAPSVTETASSEPTSTDTTSSSDSSSSSSDKDEDAVSIHHIGSTTTSSLKNRRMSGNGLESEYNAISDDITVTALKGKSPGGEKKGADSKLKVAVDSASEDSSETNGIWVFDPSVFGITSKDARTYKDMVEGIRSVVESVPDGDSIVWVTPAKPGKDAKDSTVDRVNDLTKAIKKVAAENSEKVKVADWNSAVKEKEVKASGSLTETGKKHKISFIARNVIDVEENGIKAEAGNGKAKPSEATATTAASTTTKSTPKSTPSATTRAKTPEKTTTSRPTTTVEAPQEFDKSNGAGVSKNSEDDAGVNIN